MKTRFLLPFLFAASASLADVRLPSIISDHMVVQADVQVPLWGWADVGESVTVSLAGQTVTTKPGADGKWLATLNPLKVNAKPQTLTVQGKNQLTVQDVLIGEVWLGSGQSNMAMSVASSLNYEKEQASAKFPTLRMFTVERASMTEPQTDCKGQWIVCAPDTVGRFSATAYFFGRELHQKLKQPVGLINSSWGGTAVEAWASEEAQSKLPDYPTIMAPWKEATSKPYDEVKAQADYAIALATWKEVAAKAKADKRPVSRAPKPPVNPRLEPNHPANLYNGMIAPLIPYAFRGAIWYQGESNASKPFAHLYGLQLKTLIEDWRTRWGHEFPFAWVQLPDFKAPQQAPVELYQSWPIIREQMLRTLSVPKTGMAVTLGLGEEKDIHPKNKQGVGKRLSLWALGEVYGQQVAATSGPLLKSHIIKDNTITLTFDHIGEGLLSKDGGDELKGFAIAGADKRFITARARLIKDRVVVASPEVLEPVAVRYAWADNPVWSLENSAGLPASPFRTDDWEIDIKLPALISDHMVIQAEQPFYIWGWTKPGETVTVTIADQTANTSAVSDGSWRVRLGKLPASDKPQQLIVKGPSTLTVNDVLVGEVWLASGQSNMAFQFNRGEYPATETAAAALPQIRMFTVKQKATRIPQSDCEGAWVVASPESVQSFSAVAWFFGKDLHQKLKTPVGMINSSWGGTDIAAWTSEEVQLEVPALKNNIDGWVKKTAAYDGVAAKAAHAKRVAAWKVAAEKAKAEGKPASRAPRFEPHPDVYQNRPANLFNGMIAPLIPYTLRGAIWYQGEHNCATLEKANLYATQLPLLIQDWRAKWRNHFSFAWVQLPGYAPASFRPLVREAMLKSLRVPNTGMAITVDVGEANDNHPKDKKTVGERLSLWAQARVYRQKIPAYSGPLPAGHEIKGNEVALKFDHAQSGLKSHGDTLKGFVIAGADKQFKPATAKIVGREVIVSNPDIAAPVAVRYGWASDPDGNLFNAAGLPASPFRTDTWEPTAQ
jgi:hypothetical protein